MTAIDSSMRRRIKSSTGGKQYARCLAAPADDAQRPAERQCAARRGGAGELWFNSFGPIGAPQSRYPMLRFLLTRLSLVIPTFVGITLVAFFLIRLVPGDPIETMAGERGIDAARHAALLKEHGLDRPVIVQYGIYVGRVLHGDLGKSMITREPVLSEFLTLFPATMELAVCAILLALVVGIPAGMLAATRRNSIFDHGVMGASLAGYSMPIFWWGLLLILLFSVQLGWTPVSGRISVKYFIEPVTGFLTIDSLLSGEKGAFASTLSHLVLPTIVLGTVPLAVIARMTRSSMLEVLGEDYIRTARAKGLSRVRVVALHAFRNALIPVVTVIGLQVGVLFTGAILTETIFSWPGVGKWMIEAISRRDYPVLQGGILMLGIIVMSVNLLVDITYGVINPRIRKT
jgi:dipeptide transport system permease protein